MNLGFIISSMRAGGAERVVSLLTNALINRDHNIMLYTFSNEKEEFFYPLDPRIQVFRLNLMAKSGNTIAGIFNNFHRIKVIHRVLKKSNPDILVSFMDMTNILAVIANTGLDIPLILCEHTDPNRKKLTQLWNIARELFYPKADKLVVLNEKFACYFKKFMGNKIEVIPNPVKIPKDLSHTEKIITSQRHRIIAVGRLVVLKGFDILINAFSLVADNFPDWDLFILGEGEYRLELEKLITKLNLNSRVLLPGLVNDPFSYLQNSDIFVSSSHHEGLPMSMCEAMTCKLPILATNSSSGVRELLDEGNAGILVERNDVSALSTALNQLMTDTTIRNKYGELAYNRVQKYNIENIIPQWETLFSIINIH